MQNNGKTVGENKLEKLVRLMKRYEGQLQNSNNEKVQVDIILTSDGDGVIHSTGAFVDSITSRVYNYSSLDDLFEFLESGELKRTLMVRG